MRCGGRSTRSENLRFPYDEFVLHEQRKWNRGQIEGTYFDILYTRSYR